MCEPQKWIPHANPIFWVISGRYPVGSWVKLRSIAWGLLNFLRVIIRLTEVSSFVYIWFSECSTGFFWSDAPSYQYNHRKLIFSMSVRSLNAVQFNFKSFSVVAYNLHRFREQGLMNDREVGFPTQVISPVPLSRGAQKSATIIDRIPSKYPGAWLACRRTDWRCYQRRLPGR